MLEVTAHQCKGARCTPTEVCETIVTWETAHDMVKALGLSDTNTVKGTSKAVLDDVRSMMKEWRDQMIEDHTPNE